MSKKEDPNFLSEYAVARLDIGLAIRLRTMRAEPERPGPSLEFLISPAQATEFAQKILEDVEIWKQTRRH